MITKITIEKQPFLKSFKRDTAIFEVNDMTEDEVIKEFSKVVRELGWFKPQTLICEGECTPCGTSIIES